MSQNHRKVNHELRKLGFGGLEDPTLNQQIAFCIRDHEHFKRQLFSVKAEKRRIAYAALRPHLRFAAKPLDVYEAEMKLWAETHQIPIFDGSVYPREFKPAEVRLEELAQEALRQNHHEKHGGLELVCAKCAATKIFGGKYRKDAERESHQDGWRSDGVKTYCPDCVPGRCTMNMECDSCELKYQIRCWDPQDGYAAARLRGWRIADSATCPQCAIEKLAVQ